MSAATTSMETVSPWTMGRNVSVSSLFPTPCNRDPAKSCRLCVERRSSETSGLCCLRQSERGAACGDEVSGGGIAAGYKFLNLVEEIVFV